MILYMNESSWGMDEPNSFNQYEWGSSVFKTGKNDDVSNEYYTPLELAIKLNVSLRIIREKTYGGRIPGAIKIFGQWRFRKVDIDRALLRNTF